MRPPHNFNKPLFKVLIFLIILILNSCGSSHASPKAVNGIMDLRDYDFTQGPVSLSGTWQFVPKLFMQPHESVSAIPFQPRNVPDTWTNGRAGGPGGQGYGTYRLTILLPSNHPDLGLRYTTVSTAFSVYANGVMIGGAGTPAQDKSESQAAYRPALVPIPKETNGTVELRIWVSNYEYRIGGLWRKLYLGPEKTMEKVRNFQVALDIGLASAYLTLGIHFGILFLFRRKERSFGYFSIFVFLMGLRTLLSGEYVLASVFPDLPFELLIRLEYISAYFSIPVAIFFFTSLFLKLSKKVIGLTVLLPHLPFMLLIPFAPLPVLTASIVWYYPLAYTLIILTVIAVSHHVLKNRDPWGIGMMIASLFVAIAAINDMLYAAFRIETANVLPFAIGLFVLFQYLLLSKRFTGALTESERLSTVLAKANDSLSFELEAHRQAKESLELLLLEKETHLKEIHHRVKNSLQIVSSIAALQAHRSQDDRTARALESLRERIRAVSLVHEKLYESSVSGTVDLGGYASSLLNPLMKGLWDSETLGIKGQLDLQYDPIQLPMDVCVDIGLILGELTTNTIRHVFNRHLGETLSIQIRKEQDSGVRILVSDNGPGFPEGFSPTEGESLGFKIIQILVRKRNGTLRCIPGPGGAVEILIP